MVLLNAYTTKYEVLISEGVMALLNAFQRVLWYSPQSTINHISCIMVLLNTESSFRRGLRT